MEHSNERAQPQSGGLTRERKGSDAEVSICRRQLPTPPTSVHVQPIPRSLTLAELQAFCKRIANTRLGDSICALAMANNNRMRGTLEMDSNSYHLSPDTIADSADRNRINDNVMTHRIQSRARVDGGDVVIYLFIYLTSKSYTKVHKYNIMKEVNVS